MIEDGNYFIPLSLKGVTSYFPTRTPTEEEAQKFEDMGDYLELTSDASEWDPHSTRFSELESRLVDRYGELKDGITPNVRNLFMTLTERDLYEPFRRVKIYASTTKRPGTWNSQFLAGKWGIGVDAAERTLRATSERLDVEILGER